MPRIMTGKPFQYTRETFKNTIFTTRVGWDDINERTENPKNHVLALQDMPETYYENLGLVWKVAPGGAIISVNTISCSRDHTVIRVPAGTVIWIGILDLRA